jgi:hypothetical protein
MVKNKIKQAQFFFQFFLDLFDPNKYKTLFKKKIKKIEVMGHQRKIEVIQDMDEKKMSTFFFKILTLF